ncbi:hypothetical protein [Saccharopolyspora sp. 5N708]|uniref:hypothetical protein n=1 Tax=Saccharopolyspora sp. 5N708 TaxID=3457424 RepID=UPI003FCF2134
MGLLDPSELPADAVAETVTFGRGKSRKSFTFYRVPMPCQGPALRRDSSGRYLAYMYAHFVFHWYEGESAVRIFHGDIDHPNNWTLPWTFNIEREWAREVLAERARQWTKEHLARFSKK